MTRFEAKPCCGRHSWRSSPSSTPTWPTGVLALLAGVLGDPTALGAVETLLRYVATASGAMGPEDLGRAIEEACHDEGDQIMPTAAEQWIEQWIEQGKQQGLQQGLRQGLLSTGRAAVIEALEARFDIVPRSTRERLDGVDDPVLLKTLLRKAVTTESFAAFRAAADVALS